MENKKPPNRQSSMDSNDLLQRQFRPEDSYPIVSQESFTPQVDGIQEICRYVRQEPQRTQPFACGYEFVQQRRFSAHEEYDHRPGIRQCVYPTAHYTDRLNDGTNGDGRYLNNGIQHIRFDEGPSPNQSIHQQNYELEISRRLIPHDFTKHPHRHEHSNDTSPIIPRVQDNHQLPHFERMNEQEQSPPNKHQTSESRINTGSSQQLRSPVAKRLPDAPVILQGWLHKQGSDGLHLWRRRWFVLSEFCLFYYKSQEELKLLGSILLPSYKVSACLPDDKVYRKFAFKLEHANMRTFILAAESERAMAKWIDSLNLACKLQTVHNFSVADNSIPHVHRNGALESETHRVLTTENQSTSEELTVVDRKNSKTGNTSPVTIASQPSWTTEEIPQPLYANAPPKPRRLVDGHQMSPSPDMLDRKTSEDCYSYYRRSIIEREPNQYDHQKIIRQPNYRIPQNVVPTAQHMIIERRTPDTYGRSKSISSVSRMKPPSSDYEDVYNNVNELYKPPLSPIVYGHVKKASPVPTIMVPQDRPYIPLNMEPRRHAMMQPHPHYHYPHVVMRQRPDVPQYVQIARPHSADFLDYEMKHQNVTNDRDIAIQHRQPERPKSSLDITRRSNTDNYFYSEENYAEKMRQSALYLQRDVTKHVPVKKFFTMKSDYGTPVDDVRRDFESVSSSRSSAHIPPENYDIHESDLRYKDKLRSESVLSEGSLIKDTEQEINRNDAAGHSVSSMPRSYRTVDSETYRMTSLNQDIRREESMKRLLEWKQRMLQSPLNRKLASKRIGDPSIAQHSNVSRRRKPQTTYEHRSDRHLALQNNSYSSDDEDEFGSRHSGQAGWMDEWRSSVSSISRDLNMPVVTAPSAIAIVDNYENTTVCNLNSNPIEIKIDDKSIFEHKSVSFDVILNDTDDLTKTSKLFCDTQSEIHSTGVINSGSSQHVSYDSIIVKNSPVLENQDETFTNNKKSLEILSETSGERNSEVICDRVNIETDLGVVDGLRNSNNSNLDIKNYEDIQLSEMKSRDDIEEHYMIMTPKKPISEATLSSHGSAIFESIRFEPDESSYVEMTQGMVPSLLKPKHGLGTQDVTSEVQPYEIVCFDDGKVEPVYVELGNIKDEKCSTSVSRISSLQKLDLPDILIASQKQKNELKSDSSDADDEASKDLDSLDAPCHPRFSLSDTFRPASYYLGASRVLADFHDSSDSELVSPPPIPTSSPMPDDLDTSAQDSDDRTKPTLKRIVRQRRDTVHDSESPVLLRSKKKSFDVRDPFENAQSSSSQSLEIVGDLLFYHDDSKRRSLNGSSQTVDIQSIRSRDDSVKVLLQKTDDDKLKRRPVSDNFYGELKSLDCCYLNEITSRINIEPYVEDAESVSSKDFSTVGVCSNNDSVSNFSVGLSCNFMESIKIQYGDDEFNEDCLMEHDYENMCIVLQSAENKDSNHSSSSTNTLTSSASGSTLIAREVLHQCKINSPVISRSPYSHSSMNIDASRYSYDFRFIPDDDSGQTLPIYPPRRHSEDVVKSISESVNYYSGNTLQNDDISQGITKSESSQVAPYYYSDLPAYHSTEESSRSFSSPRAYLNNQRYETSANKRDILHIMNPINSKRQSQEHSSDNHDKVQLASEARSASMEFLNMNEKTGNIDKRNIYESDSLKRQKCGVDSIISLQSNPETRNLYPSVSSDKTNTVNFTDTNTVRRCHSLEGLLWNVLNKSSDDTSCADASNDTSYEVENESVQHSENITVSEGDYLWEEDRLWRESLRRVSHRHARSLDDLENVNTADDSSDKVIEKVSDLKPNRNKVARSVTYVNDSIAVPFRSKDIVLNSNDTYVCLSRDYCIKSNEFVADTTNSKIVESNETKYRVVEKDKSTFIIDREKLRQWDLMSSAPVLSNRPLSVANDEKDVIVVDKRMADGEIDRKDERDLNDCSLQTIAASGSVSISGHDVIRSNTSHSWSENSRRETVASPMHISNPHLAFIRHPNISDSRSSSPQVNYSVSSQRGDLSVVSNEERMMYPNSCRMSNDEIASSDLKLSAGELLGRTHEELVLLLIQLRRQSVNLYQAIEACYSEIYMLQNSVENDAALRLENFHRLDQLKQHLLDLEKQYEKGKPLVNLVDNMVKLGSLYRQSNQPDRILEARSRNRIEFNQHVQERRLLAEERRDWDHINPDHSQLQSKVQQLYELDGILRRESDTLAGLRQDKESLEQALYGLRMKLGGMRVPSIPPAELEWARRHQQLLEQELSRVHLLLAYNSKKLEETVAGNARLEQELIVLRQKLQMSRQQKNNNFYSNTIPKQRDRIGTGNGAMLEAELRRVQRLVGDLQRQRQELSTQVRHLIDKSHTLVQQIHRPAPTPLAVSQSIEQGTNNKKRTQTSWLETDLDSGITREHSFINTSVTRCDSGNSSSGSLPNSLSDRPFTDDPIAYHRHRRSPQRLNEDSTSTIISSESDIQHPNTISHEKQEIKTVRIVKRESERRQRDRERTSCIGIPITSTCNNNFSSDGSTLSYGTGNRWGPLDEEDHDNEHSAGHKSISNLKNFDENNLETNSFGLPENSNEFDTTVVHDSSVIPSFSADAKVSTSQSTLSEISPSNSIFITYDEDSKAASSDKSPVPSPIFKSAAAQQIIIEMSGNISDRALVTQNSSRRTIPKEKRRHYTAPHNNILIEDSSRSGPGSDTFNRMNVDMGRARDDLDMERALRPRINTPDVVRSTLSHKELKYNEGTIDSVLGTPNKIIIPERYIPEQTPQLSAEEQKQRLQKVESIKKMLSDSTPLTATSLTDISNKGKSTHSGMKQTSISEEKRQREHLLQLNQILAKQVMEMSKIVAGTTSNQRL